jgi:S-phase kinase-associated protein 1
MNDDQFTIVSSDKVEFTLTLAAAKENWMIRDLVNATQATNLRMDGERAEGVPEINSACLKRVVVFSTYHAENPETTVIKDEKDGSEKTVPLVRSLKPDDMSDWDKDFVSEDKLDQKALFDLILAANYLNNKLLLDVTCKALANRLKGKSSQEIVAYFKKVYPFDKEYTPEEEAQTRKDYPWIENPNKKNPPPQQQPAAAAAEDVE